MILRPVASFSQSMSPWRAMATPFTPEMTSTFRTFTSQITYFPNSISIFDFWAGPLRGLDPSKKMRIECLHLQKGWHRGSISHQRSTYVGFRDLSESSLGLLAIAMYW